MGPWWVNSRVQNKHRSAPGRKGLFCLGEKKTPLSAQYLNQEPDKYRKLFLFFILKTSGLLCGSSQLQHSVTKKK